jgi:hypothetical protein
MDGVYRVMTPCLRRRLLEAKLLNLLELRDEIAATGTAKLELSGHLLDVAYFDRGVLTLFLVLSSRQPGVSSSVIADTEVVLPLLTGVAGSTLVKHCQERLEWNLLE